MIDQDNNDPDRKYSSDEEDDHEEIEEGNKAERNRERNREHAKKTRLRKKEMMETMKARLLDLQREVRIYTNCFCCEYNC